MAKQEKQAKGSVSASRRRTRVTPRQTRRGADFARLCVITAGLVISSSAYSEECTTDPGLFWLCKGDPAFDTGYLVPPAVLDLNECRLWEEKAALVDALVSERDTFQQQRDDAIRATDALNAALTTQALNLTEATEQLAVTQAALDSAFPTWQVAVIATVVGVVSLGVGLGVGAVVY